MSSQKIGCTSSDYSHIKCSVQLLIWAAYMNKRTCLHYAWGLVACVVDKGLSVPPCISSNLRANVFWIRSTYGVYSWCKVDPSLDVEKDHQSKNLVSLSHGNLFAWGLPWADPSGFLHILLLVPGQSTPYWLHICTLDPSYVILWMASYSLLLAIKFSMACNHLKAG